MPVSKQAPATSTKPAKPAKAASRLEDRLARLGLKSDMDLVLHLPMRYEDETEVVEIRQAGFVSGSPAQVEGIVTSCGTNTLTASSLRGATTRSTGSLTTMAPTGMVVEGAPLKVSARSLAWTMPDS